MIKQILGWLPKKPLKGGETRNAKDVVILSHSSSSSSGLTHGNRGSHSEDLRPKENTESYFCEPLLSFREVPNTERLSLFIRKLSLRCNVFDFTDPTENQKEREIKKQTLLELVDYLTSSNGKITEITVQEVVKMVSASLFRPLMTQSYENKVVVAYDFDDEKPV